MKSAISVLNSPELSPTTSPKPKYLRKPYKKFQSPTVPESPVKLPPILSPKTKNTQNLCSKKSLEKKLSLYIDLGLTPKIPLSHKNLMKFKNAKKKTITLSDFMSKSAQKQLIETSSLSEIKDDDFFIKPRKREKECLSVKLKQPTTFYWGSFRRFNQGSFKECRCTEGKNSRSRVKDLKIIDEIVGSCEDLLKRKVGDFKGKSKKCNYW